MREELQPLRETKTLVLEKTENSVESLPMQEKKDAKKILFEEATPQKYVEEHLKKLSTPKNATVSQPIKSKFEFEATKSFSVKIPEKESLSAVEKNIIESKPEIKPEITREVEKELEPLHFTQKEVEEEVTTKVEEKLETVKRLKPKVGLKSRLKIIFFGFFAVLTCLSGWAIYNAVEIETLRAQMEATNKTYAVNMVNYINTLSKTDDLTTDSLFNLQGLSEAGIIPVQPNTEDRVEYTVKSNWFDRFCNWFSGIFR